MPALTSSVHAYFHVTPYHKEQVDVCMLAPRFDADTRHEISVRFFMNRCMGVSWHMPTTVNVISSNHVLMAYWDKDIMLGIEGIIFPRILIFKRRGQVDDIDDNDTHEIQNVITQLVRPSFPDHPKFILTLNWHSLTIACRSLTKVVPPSKTFWSAAYTSSPTGRLE